MENFYYQNTTKIIFGRETESRVGTEVKRYSRKIMLHYGGGSIKKTGLYNRVIQSLKEEGIDFIELAGAQPNPRLSLVKEGIKLCRENGIDFILAVGGGSAIDSAKAIAIGVPYEGEVWDFFTGKDIVRETLPVGVILTIPAAGSETSVNSVITNEDGWIKISLSSERIRPVFAILNPELLFTLPTYQTACGAADMMAHIMERYFTNTPNVELIDRLCEASLKTIIHNAPLVIKEPTNYDAWAEMMWAGTIAHNGLLGTGRVPDWASHMIEHELSAIYDVAHGAGLAVVIPAWMKYVYRYDFLRFAQFAVRVWNREMDFQCPEKVALEGIDSLTEFFKRIGLPVTLQELGIPEARIEEMADKCTRSNTKTVGKFVKLDQEAVLNILKGCN